MYSRKFVDRNGISKTKKYIAKGMPDRVSLTVDDSAMWEDVYQKWKRRWVEAMYIKHSGLGAMEMVTMRDVVHYDRIIHLEWRLKAPVRR